MVKPSAETNRYKAIIERIFYSHWKKGAREFEFLRSEIEDAALKLKLALPKNFGDTVYSIRYRTPLPSSVVRTQPKGLEWIIEGAGKGKYRFKLVPANRIRPREDMAWIAIPDATPEVIRLYKLDDEQALLAIVRYNRLVDIFLGLTTFSLQNHLRTTVRDVGQIEIDELYVGLDSEGRHYVIPVQAKGGKDQIGVVQTTQDIRYCLQKFPELRCRPIAAQFLSEGVVALFELKLQNDEVRVSEERHYKLVPASEIEGNTSDSSRAPR
ncbi:MAG: endonuclease [Proteobacteria bacterium]|nr:endonuclease [Pseudomonadota bacterium]